MIVASSTPPSAELPDDEVVEAPVDVWIVERRNEHPDSTRRREAQGRHLLSVDVEVCLAAAGDDQ